MRMPPWGERQLAAAVTPVMRDGSPCKAAAHTHTHTDADDTEAIPLSLVSNLPFPFTPAEIGQRLDELCRAATRAARSESRDAIDRRALDAAAAIVAGGPLSLQQIMALCVLE